MQELPPRTTEIVRITATEEQLAIHHGNLRIVRQIASKPYISEMDLLRLRSALLNCRMSADSTILVDESAKAKQAEEAERLAKREKVAAAGGQLLTAGFTLLGELLGSKAKVEPSPAVTEQIKSSLADRADQE